MKATTAAALGVAAGLVVGVASGAASASTPETRTPRACHRMADIGMEAFQLWADVVTATRERGDALDPKTYAVHDAEVNHLIASLEAVAPKYDGAEDDCLEGS